MKNKRLYFSLLLALLLSCFAGLFSACGPESQPPEPVLYTVTFVSDGDVYHTATTDGSCVSFPAEPAKNEMVFKGWFLDNGIWRAPFDKQSVSSSPVTSDISVYALWENMSVGLAFELMPHEESFLGRLYDPFYSVPDMYKELNEDPTAQAYCVSNYTGTDTDVQIPAMYNGKFVTAIKFYAFLRNPYNDYGTKLTSVWIPDSIIRIDYGAFEGNTCMTDVRMSQNIVSIGIDSNDLTGPFQDCPNLKSIILPESLKFIGTSAFSRTGLTSIRIPDNVTSIWFSAFGYCAELTNVKIGSGVKAIDTSAFNRCLNLTTVTIDSETIAGSMSLKTSNGSLLFYADTVYIKSDISLIGDYITSHFTKSTDTVIMDNVSYYVYTLNI